ncbi:MAG: glycerol kinase GlpK [Clostridia bacterium]|nr:glycerol kinase GlpK [Clostridia bacterium]
MSYILSIDQSTQGTKALLFDAKGKVVAREDLPHRQIINEIGWVEHDPSEILKNVIQVSINVIEASGIDQSQIRAMGISNQRETCIAWDRESGAPLYNAIVWQCARASELCKALEPHAESIRKKTGLNLSPYFSGAKLAWMMQNVESVQQAAEHHTLCMGTVDAFLVHNLTEEKAFKTDYSNASRTQLFNIRDLVWDEEICALYGIPMDALGQVCMSDSIFGHTTLGGYLKQPIPICGVLGDSHGALLGQQCRKPGEVKSTYGTGSSVMMQTGETLVESQHGLVTSLAWGLNGKVEYVLEGNLNYTGATITWLKDDAKLISSAAESEVLANEANPQDNCYLVPAFSGLGAPYWDSDASAIITGMSRTTGRAEIVRAGLESIGYQITDLILAMQSDAGIPVTELRVDGGPTANKYLMQFQSDIADVSLRIPDLQELSAMGAAFAAGFACGLYDTQTAWDNIAYTHYHPQKDDAWRDAKYAGWKKAVKQVLLHD